MIVQLEQNIQANDKETLLKVINGIGYKSNEVTTQMGSYLVCIGKKEFDMRQLGALVGVQDIHRVSDDYKLVSGKWKVGRTAIDLGDGVILGDGNFAMMGGPCSIESEEQIESTVNTLVKNNVKIMRGGVYKPRSSPYSFRGMGMDGLKLFYKACNAKGIKIITEVMEVGQIKDMLPFVDIFQVGARNSQNFNLLDELGNVDKAVMIKRGISGTIDELLYSAEYIFSNGNEKILLCERGIRTYETAYRNTLDLNAIPILKEKTHLPVIADPSHGVGVRKYVEAMTLASLAAGADGAIIEMHETPERAASDAQQTLSYQEFEQLLRKVRAIEEVTKTF
jgi:3-deoxy-7-phosphoheptulonate synthase